MSKKTKHREKKRIRGIQAKQNRSKKESLASGEILLRKIRVGYISDAFCSRPEADFLPVFFAARDKHNFTVVGISLTPDDEVTKMFREGADEWLDISSMTAMEAVSAVRELKLDFLVDITAEASAKLTAVMEADVAEFTEEADSWCYTPFDKNRLYTVTAPVLYKGYPTLGVIGSLFASDEVLPHILSFMEECPQCRLLLHGRDAELCQDEELAETLRKLTLGDRILISTQTQYPYDEVDVLLGLQGIRSYAMCRAYNHSMPILLYTDYMTPEPFMVEIAKAVGMEDLCAATPEEFKEKLHNLLQDQDRVTREHRTLRYRFQCSEISDLDGCIMKWERRYLERFYRKNPFKTVALLKAAAEVRKKQQWENVIPLLAAASVYSAEFPKEEALNLAWGYYFQKDLIRALYWAQKAEKLAGEKIITALYLQAEILSKADRYIEAGEAIEKAFAFEEKGYKMLPEIKDALLPMRAGIAYRLGRKETSDLYWQAYGNAHDFPNRCLCYSAWLMSYNPQDIDRQLLYEKHLGYEALFKDIKPYSHTLSRHRHSKQRIGYISPDLHAHVMSSFLWPFLATYNHDEYEVYVYSIGAEDNYTETFKMLVDKWCDMQGIEYAQIAAKIYADEVDILFDLAGHTSNSGLPVLGYKPAPVQISGLGYMTTTGLTAVDYFLTDRYVDPLGLNDAYFSEKLLPLTTQFCYTGADNLPESPYAPCRDKGYVLFGVFNHLAKYTESMVLAWKEILRRVPQGKLLLKCNPLADLKTTAELYKKWEEMGMPMDRIIFEASSSDYMYRYLDVDIALDTYPYPGGGTTCDALYMGVPVVARYGERHSSRFGYSILCQLGLTELTAVSNEEYIEKATALARDWELLDTFHQRLRSLMKSSPLMDVKSYMAEVEKAYRHIWQEYCEGHGEEHGKLC